MNVKKKEDVLSAASLNGSSHTHNVSFDSVASHSSHLITPSSKIYFIWFAATFLYFFQFFLRASPTVMVDPLMREFQVDAESLGVLASFYYIAYSCLQIPMGLLIDKIGIRKILLFSVVMCTLGTFVFAMAQTLFVAKMGRLFMGVGSAAVFLSCLKIITLWFPKKRFGLFLGLSMMMGTFGAISAQGPLAYFVQSFGWRESLVGFGFLGFIWTFFIFLIVRDRKAPVGLKASSESLPFLESLKIVLTNKQVIMASLYGLAMYTILSGFADLWGTPYLMRAFQLDRPSAAAASSAIYIGLAFGGPCFGYLSEILKSRKIPMLLSPVGAIIAFSLFVYSPSISFTFVYILLFILGFFVGGKLMNFAIATDSVPASVSGTATGVVNTFAMLSGVIAQPLIGKLLCFNWDGKIIDGVAHYALSDYCFAFSVIPVSMILAIIFTLLTKETLKK